MKEDRDEPIDNSLDDLLEERKDDKPAVEQLQSQRYNKKRKIAEMSNDEPDPIQSQ